MTVACPCGREIPRDAIRAAGTKRVLLCTGCKRRLSLGTAIVCGGRGRGGGATRLVLVNVVGRRAESEAQHG